MQKLVNRLKEKLKKASANVWVNEAFSPLRKQHPDLAADFADFCLTGEPVDALNRAQQLTPDDSVKYFGPIANSSWYWVHKKTLAMQARSQLYELAGKQDLDAAVLVRLGKILATIFDPQIQKHTHAGFPDWLHVLLTDWCHQIHAETLNPPAIRLHDDVCLAGELLEPYWLHYYLDRVGVRPYWSFQEAVSSYRKMPGIADYLISHRDYITQTLYPRLCAAGKAQCLREFGELKIKDSFADFIIAQAVSSSKTVRAEIAGLLSTFDKEQVAKTLGHYLTEGASGERKEAAQLIAKVLAGDGQALLQKARAAEKTKSVLAAIDIALGSLSDPAPAAGPEQNTASLVIPEYAQPDLNARVGDHVVDLIDAIIKQQQQKFAALDTPYDWLKKQKKTVLGLSRSDAIRIVGAMNGEARLKLEWHELLNLLNFSQVLQQPSVKLINTMRLYQIKGQAGNRVKFSYHYGPLPVWIKKHPGELADLRALEEVNNALGWPADTISSAILNQHWGVSFLFEALPKDGIWPYFADKIDLLLTPLLAHGAANPDYRNSPCLDRVLEVLGCFPQLPEAVHTPLLHLAVVEGKTYRERAQALLCDIPGIEHKIFAALSASTQENRSSAARWLAKLGKSNAVGPLRAALAKESRESVRATILSSLEILGEDISALLTPEILLKEAQKGLRKKMPKSLEWFPFDSLPELNWRNAKRVDPAIPKWWIVLACKLKEPGGNELLLKYLQLLAAPSQQALGLYVLQAFIAQDTRHPGMDEAEAQARQRAPGLYQSWQHWAKHEWGKTYQNRTLQDAHAEIRNEVSASYLGSAIKDKGILALCAYSPGADTVAIVRAYMKDHYTRRAQIESILHALAASNDRHIIQFFLSVARRYRTRSVQETARALVQAIAERNRWSEDELADRTLPSAGFDSSGRLQLDYGSRRFNVLLGDDLKPILQNEDGKTIKSLPPARQADDEALVKEAKAQFSTCKKELKQVIALTSGRLYEAMCAEREWPAQDWVRYLLRHPIASRMAQRLVWELRRDDHRTWFRPSEDGALIDCDDEDVELPETGIVRLAHRSLLSPQQAQAWQSHLKDYAVKPLFEQLERPVVELQTGDKKSLLDDYEGYCSDAFSLRGLFSKLGYQRGEAEDGGFFYYYYKDFSSLGLKAVIFFSGNCLPEENVAAALEAMGFCKRSHSGWFSEDQLLPLADVPPILLSEVFADYQSIAAKTGGYDADWRKKMPW